MMKTRIQGFTLIEFLVAIVISLIGMLAATEAYVATRQTYRLQGMQSRLTEDGRFALSMIQRTVSQAGFRRSPIVALPADRISIAANVVTVRFDPDGGNQISCDGSVPIAGVAQTLVIQKNATKLTCATNGAAAVDWIAPAAAGAGNGTEVMDFVVFLGIDTGPVTPVNFGCGPDTGTKPRDCIADAYSSALSVGQTDQQIVSARICLVLRTEASDGSVIKPAAVQNCSAGAIANSQNDNKLYRTYWTTVLLKNR